VSPGIPVGSHTAKLAPPDRNHGRRVPITTFFPTSGNARALLLGARSLETRFNNVLTGRERMSVVGLAAKTDVIATRGVGGPRLIADVVGFRRSKSMLDFQFEDPEQIVRAVIDHAGVLLALSWQACFVSQDAGDDRIYHHRFQLLGVAGDVPLSVLRLHPMGLDDVRGLDATIIPIEHAGRVSGMWLIGPQRHGAHLGPAQMASLAELARLAAAPLEVALLRAWIERTAGMLSGVDGAMESDLTARQLVIARLVGRGLTNEQIGAELGIRRGTVAKHIEHIMARLGVRSRAQIAAWIATTEPHVRRSANTER
jgi:DNA-binding CsgD family transcriptional regulator